MDGSARMVRAAVAAAAVCLLGAAPAAAQDPEPTPTAPPPAEATPEPTATPTPEATPEPVDGALTVKVAAPYRDGGRRVALRGQRVRIKGTLTPFVAGQKAVVRVKKGGKTLVKRRVPVRRAKSGAKGVYAFKTRLWRRGTLAVRAVHPRSKQMRTARAETARVVVAKPSASYGAGGPVVRLLQRKLRKLRYLSGGITGRYDAALGRAVMAWRKVNGRSRVYSADSSVVRDVLAGKGAWRVRHPDGGRHVEADISRQALALVDGDRVVRVFPTSSGAPATPTVLGEYRFYRKDPGTNAIGMVHSSYFIRGYAIHGYHSVPTYNASHGCLRVPIPDAWRIYSWIRLGDRIFVEP